MLPAKHIERTLKELVDLHKRVLTQYLISLGIEYPTRRKFFKIYDHYIDYKNIRLYFYTPLRILVRALILDKLDLVQNIAPLYLNELMTIKRKPTKKRKGVKCIKV